MLLYLPYRDEIVNTRYTTHLKNNSKIDDIRPYFFDDRVYYEILIGAVRVSAKPIDDYV